MADPRQEGLLDLLTLVSRPLAEDAGLHIRTADGAPLLPAAEESVSIRSTLNLRQLGIGIAPRGRPCSLFDWNNMVEAMAVARLLTKQTTYDECVRVAAAIHDVVNEEIYVFGLMYAILHRPDTRSMRLPPVEEVLPYWYFPSDVIADAENRVKRATTTTERIVVPFEFPHNELDHEFRVAYFREDIAINSHHWHWHVAYPFTWEPEGPNDIKDRKGELFYYMHHQVMARYDIERLCNSLGRVRPLSDFRHVFEEAYFPNLRSALSGRSYAARQANTQPKDTAAVTIERLGLWKTRIMDAIHTGFVVDKKGVKMPLVEPKGIDMLGDIVEAAAISINRDFYGDYHNFGHRLIARAHDPDGKYADDQGVMAFSATAMRDPIFYKWHKAIDDIFNEYKETATPYTKQELEWSDIRVLNVSVTGVATKRNNFLQTFWQDREVLMSRGIDFGRPNPVVIRFRHLQHEEFVYDIEVENTSKANREVLVRIFLSAVSNEFGDPLTFDEQRLLFIELEKYQVAVKPGKQVLKRKSEDSNVTIPSTQGFQQLGAATPGQPPSLTEGFCGCGWPGHLLLPKGRPEGMRFVLLVMVTDWEKDKVENVPNTKSCGDAASYCGIRDQRYPDKRPMGFPFDRPFNVGETIDNFASMTNVATKEIIIRHSGEVVDNAGVFKPAPIF